MAKLAKEALKAASAATVAGAKKVANVCRPMNIDQLAAGKQAHVIRDSQGRLKLISAVNRSKYITFDTEIEVRQYLNQLGIEKVKTLDDHLPTVHDGGVSSSIPVRPNDGLTATRRFIKTQQLRFKVITPIKSLTQAIESLGKGVTGTRAYSLVYEPTQKAAILVGRKLGIDLRKNLKDAKNPKGLSYEDALHNLERDIAGKLDQDQQRHSVLLSEAFTKSEIARTAAQGGMVEAGMSVEEQIMSTLISRTGHAENIPLFVRMNQVVDSFLEKRSGWVDDIGEGSSEIKKLEDAILEGKLSPEAQPFLDRLKLATGTEETWEELVQTMGLTLDETAAFKFVRESLAEPDLINLPLVFRHATAPELKAGYANGRAQYIAEKGVSADAVTVANRRDQILDEAFGETAWNRQQVLGMHLPVFRQFADVGLFSDPKLASVLNQLPEGREVLTRRVLSGHLNPYELHPSVTAFKHVRNLIMKEHFDPASVDALKELSKLDPKTTEFKILTNYLHEIEGRPGEGFAEITKALRMVGRYSGTKIDDKLVERSVRTLVKLSYSAAIPFRAALVIRNYLQTMLFTLPVIGPKAWAAGMAEANPLTWAAMQKNIDIARKAGAIDANVTPLYGADQVLGRFGESRLTHSLGPAIQKAGMKIDDLFEMGFTAYRSADDWGRTVAFFAGRSRVAKNIEKFHLDGDIEKLIQNSKVRVFDETVEIEFRSLIANSDWPGAQNYIGKQLADKTHLLYGNANRPAGWGGIGGKLFGQFGTFPIQYADYVVDGLSRGSIRDRMEWAGMHVSINAGIIVAGDEVFGADLFSWATLPSLTYTGGPYADAAVNLFQAIGGSDLEQSLARRNLTMMLPTFDSPHSSFIPGSYFAADLQDAYQENTIGRIFGEGMGVKFMEPREENVVYKIFGFMGL